MAPQYKLTYFNIKGYGEPIRFLLSYLGADFEDVRIEFENWESVKPSIPYGKVPILEIDGKTVAQSTAIARYLGKKAGLAGKDEWENLMIDMAVDIFGDVMQEVVKCIREKDEKLKTKMIENVNKETIPFFMGKLDQLVKENDGYLANKKLSWADIWVTSVIDATQDPYDYNISAYPYLKALQDKVFAIPKIKAWIEKRP